MNNLLSFYYLYFIHRQRQSQRQRQRALTSSVPTVELPPRPLHSRYRKAFKKSLTAYQRRLRDRRIPRAALVSTKRSPWRRVLHAQCDQTLITVTGLDHASLHFALTLFTPLFDNYTPHNCDVIRPIDSHLGRPRKIRAEDCLGIFLCWSRSQASLLWMQMIFGMTYSNLSVYLTFAIRLFIEIFRDHPLARVRLPSRAEVRGYQDLVSKRHPILCDVWFVMDGIKLSIEKASEEDKQNMFFNGWKQGHYVTAALCFAPDGTIPIAYFNVPGCASDSNVCDLGGVYAKLERVYEKTGGKCAVDSAFAGRRCRFLIKSGKDVYYSTQSTRRAVRYDIRRKQEATSLRQSAEWGMRALQSSFPRLYNRFRYEENRSRAMMLKSLVLLYNMRARRVGINQIRNVYQPCLDIDAQDIFGIPTK